MTVEIEPTQKKQEIVEESQPILGLDQEKLDYFRKDYDVEQVSRQGLTDSDVVEHIRQFFPEFDYEKATSLQKGVDSMGREITLPGYSNREIVQFFTKSTDAGPIEAFVEQTKRGITRGLPTAGGVGVGITAGSSFGLPGMIIGGLYGFYAGDKAGEQIEKALFPEPSVYAPSVRPFGESGYSFGSGLAFSTAPYTYLGLNPAVVEGVRRISSLSGRTTPLETIVKTALDQPKRSLTLEATASGGAATGALMAETQDPGNTALRTTYEVGLGVFSPVSIGARFIETIGEKILSFGSSGMKQTRQGREILKWLNRNAPIDKSSDLSEAQQREAFVQKIYASLSTEDGLKKVARELGVDESKLPTRTTAAIVDDPLLYGLQAKLGLDPNDGGRIRKAIDRDYKGVQNLIRLMYGSGDPALIAEAAKIRTDFYKGLIVKRLDLANIQAFNLIKKIPPTKIVNGVEVPNPRAAMEQSEKIETLTQQALRDVREYESKLYDKVDKNETLSVENFIKEFENMQKELSANDLALPSSVTAFFNRAKGKPLAVSDDLSQRQSRLDRRIKNAEESIAKVNSAYPQSVEDAMARFNKDTSLEDQLNQIQSELKFIEETPVKILSKTPTYLNVKGAEKNRQINVLKNQAQIIDARLNKLDLDRMEPTPVDPEEISLGDAMFIRSVLLNQARQEAGPAGNVLKAHFLHDLAEGLREDFGIASGKTKGGISQLTDNQRALSDAFAFSSSLNDVFTRAFPNQVLAKAKTGARRIMPELLSKAAFGGGGDATSLKYEQLDDAVMFAAQQTGKNPEDTAFARIGSMRAAQEDLLRSELDKLVDKDGNLTENQLFKFNKAYRNVLFDRNGESRFPELTESLADIETAQRTVNLIRQRQARHEKALANSIIFNDLGLAKTNPQKLIKGILGNPETRTNDDPSGAFTKLIRAAKSADMKRASDGKPTGAVEGLKDMVFEDAWAYSTGKPDAAGKEAFNFKAFSNYLTTPFTGKSLSPLAIMQKEGVLSSAEATRLSVILSEGKKAQGQRALADIAEDATEPGGLVTKGFDTLVRLIGLRVGRKATQIAPGQGQGLAEPMMIANEFSALLNIPRLAHRDILLEAVENPEMFKLLMEKANQAGPKGLALQRRFNTFLLNSGYISATDYEREQKRREFNPRDLRNMPSNINPPKPQASLERSPAAPTGSAAAPRPSPIVTAQAPVATQPPAPQARPADRSRFAAMFPSDITSSVIEAQGIESLLG